MQHEKIPTNPVTFFWFFIKKQKLVFASLFLVTIVAWPVQEAVFPYIHKMLVDALINFDGDKAEIFTTLKPILTLGLIVLLTSDIGFRIQDWIYAKSLPDFCANIRMQMFNYCQFHSMRYFANNSTGGIAMRINRMPEIAENFIRTLFIITIPIFITVLISTFFLFSINNIFGIIWVVWFVFHMSLTFFFMNKYSHLSGIHASSSSMLSGKIVDVIMNISSVKLFARHRYEFDLLQKSQNKEITDSYNAHKYRTIIKTILGIASTTMVISMIFSSIYSWQQDLITLADLVLILSYIRLIGLVWFLGENIVVVFGLLGTTQDSLALISKPHKVSDVKNAKKIDIKKGAINFENVSFQYSQNKLLFKNCSLAIKPKQKIGLVGFSGSGKTTFINLILRYFDINSGTIKIDGADISKIQQNSLRDQISVIPQDPILFERSIIDNIKYGKPNATDEEVFEAAEKSYAHEFIMELRDGYDSVIGEKSINLSGGQKQRIAIARAILKNAPILILDEATSSLDSFTEDYIQKALDKLMEDKTVIAIAHRISTLLGMDRIMVFNKGEIVEDATHQELLDKKGYYHQLWNMQSGGFIPEE